MHWVYANQKYFARIKSPDSINLFLDWYCLSDAASDACWCRLEVSDEIWAKMELHSTNTFKSHSHWLVIGTKRDISSQNYSRSRHIGTLRAATAGKAGKGWTLPRFWVSIRSYKKQPVKKFGVEYWAFPGSNSPRQPCSTQGRHWPGARAFYFSKSR